MFARPAKLQMFLEAPKCACWQTSLGAVYLGKETFQRSKGRNGFAYVPPYIFLEYLLQANLEFRISTVFLLQLTINKSIY